MMLLPIFLPRPFSSPVVVFPQKRAWDSYLVMLVFQRPKTGWDKLLQRWGPVPCRNACVCHTWEQLSRPLPMGCEGNRGGLQQKAFFLLFCVPCVCAILDAHRRRVPGELQLPQPRCCDITEEQCCPRRKTVASHLARWCIRSLRHRNGGAQ
jgi:hypothetical protein